MYACIVGFEMGMMEGQCQMMGFQIVTSRQITRAQREEQWATLSADAAQGGLRPFCREADYAGRMWSGNTRNRYQSIVVATLLHPSMYYSHITNISFLNGAEHVWQDLVEVVVEVRI